MGKTKWLAALCAAGSLLAGMPAAAKSEVQAATQLRQLDMMLMVTSLRCRFGADDFRVDYDAFRKNHAAELKTASLLVLGDMTKRLGRNGAVSAYDRLSTGMANSYGMGHPRLGCAELKQATRSLASARGLHPLADAADGLLSEGAGQRGTMLAQR
jgi:hypothetical protein